MTINSTPLYSYLGQLLQDAKEHNKKLHAYLLDPQGNTIIDDYIVDRNSEDSIITINSGEYECSAITRDIVFGYEFRIKVE